MNIGKEYWTKAAAEYCSRMERFPQVKARSEYEPVVDAFKEPVAGPVPPEEVPGERPGWGHRMQVPSFAVIRAIRTC